MIHDLLTQLADILKDKMACRSPSHFESVVKTFYNVFVECGSPVFTGDEGFLYNWESMEALFRGMTCSVQHLPGCSSIPLEVRDKSFCRTYVPLH